MLAGPIVRVLKQGSKHSPSTPLAEMQPITFPELGDIHKDNPCPFIGGPVARGDRNISLKFPGPFLCSLYHRAEAPCPVQPTADTTEPARKMQQMRWPQNLGAQTGPH